jgi:predicted nucleotidyltransferase
MKKLREDTTWSKEEKTLLARCRLAIESVDPSAKVILYGSRARGEAGPDSDYDLLIITDGEVTLRREDVLRQKLYPIEMETGAVLTVILVSSKDWGSALYAAMPFYQNIQRDGVVL